LLAEGNTVSPLVRLAGHLRERSVCQKFGLELT